MNSNQGLLAIKNKPRNFERQRKIKIDVGKTQYPLIRNVATSDMGWTLWGREDQKGDANLFWFDTYITQQTIRRLKTYQRVNHFPNSQQLGKKNLLSENLKKMKNILPNEYNFYPETWILPDHNQQFAADHKFKQSQGKDKWYIIKPSASSQGKGIYLTKSAQMQCKQPQIVQQYIDNPLLIDGCKFDLRIYVLIKSLMPLKIFRFQQGLTRLATVPYENPTKMNRHNLNMHLTNYAINKLNPSFVQNKNIQDDFVGHKRSLSGVFRYLESIGCDKNKINNEINQVIVKTIISAHPKLLQTYKQCREVQLQSQSVCFQILGFDILIDANFKPWLLQINHSPSFCTQSPLDFIIKKYLVLDTLVLLNLNAEEKQNYLKNKTKESAGKDRDMYQTKKKTQILFEDTHLGAFQKIYPAQNEVYHKIWSRIRDRDRKFKSLQIKRSVQNKSSLESTSACFDQQPQNDKFRKRNAFTLYGQFRELKKQVETNCEDNCTEQSQIKRHASVEKDRRKNVQPIKLNNVNISFYQESKTHYNGFFSKRGVLVEQDTLPKPQTSLHFAYDFRTSETRRYEIKKLDNQIRTRIGKMKLARIKLNKIKSSERKAGPLTHRVMITTMRQAPKSHQFTFL